MSELDNTSASGGYLLPVNPIINDDDNLDDILHDFYMGLTNLDPTLVRPRWVITPGNLPDIKTEWMSFGVTNRKQDTFVSQIFDPSKGMIVQRYEHFDCIISVYGRQADHYTGLIRDGMFVEQNREVIKRYGIVVVEIGQPKTVPMLINERWNKRIDVTISFRRQLVRVYPIESLVSAEFEVNSDVTNITD